MLPTVHYNEAYLVLELCPSFHIRKGGKNLGKRWATALSAAPTGVQASTTPKMEAETDQRSETLCSVRNVTHKINEVANHTTFNIPQIFFTIYVLQQTYWASLMDPRTTSLAIIAIRALGPMISRKSFSYFSLIPRHFTPHLTPNVSFRGTEI